MKLETSIIGLRLGILPSTTTRMTSRSPRLQFFLSSRRRHTRFDCDWSSDVCSSDLPVNLGETHAQENSTNLFDVGAEHVPFPRPYERGEGLRIVPTEVHVPPFSGTQQIRQIGRASCRERV